MTSDKLSILHLGVLAMTRLCQTLLNHYYGNWFYVLPYRLLYIVQLCVFTHDCSVLLTVSPPPLPANIYTEAVRKEGEKEGRPTKYFFIVHSLYNITLHQNSTDIGGHPGVFIGTWRHLYVGLFTPLPRQIYKYMNEGREERKREGGKSYYCTRISS